MQEGYGVCPVCNGTKRIPADKDEKHKSVVSGYDAATDTHSCRNCGYQYMFGRASGEVRLRPDGTPCKHEYTSCAKGRCLTSYECKLCGDLYTRDSGG